MIMLENELSKLDLCGDSMKEVKSAGGYFERLPADDFVLIKILGYLPNTDLLNIRTLSSWFLLRVSQTNQRLFNLYNIKDINNANCVFISATLDKLMARNYILNKQLRLQFVNLNATSREIMIKYRSNIISLDVCINGDVRFLLQPHQIFDQLESLTITSEPENDHSGDRLTLESLVSKHADKLKMLKLDGIGCEDLTLPNLPKLILLSLKRIWVMDDVQWNMPPRCERDISTRALWSLLRAGQPVSLEVDRSVNIHKPDISMLRAQAVPIQGFQIQVVDNFAQIPDGLNQPGNEIQGFDPLGIQNPGFNPPGNPIPGLMPGVDQPGNLIPGFNLLGNPIQGINPEGNQIQGLMPGFDPPVNQNVVPEMEVADAVDFMLHQIMPGVDLSGYKMPNLRHLKMISTFSACYLQMNAAHIVSLTMRDSDLMDLLPGIFFPNLRELNIDGSYLQLMYLLEMCWQSLECLVYTGDRSFDSYFEFYVHDIPVLPRLTDLYLHNTESCRKFMSSQHRSLEFLYLENVSPLHSLVDDVNMENMKTVVIKHTSDKQAANMKVMHQNHDHDQELEKAEMERMCPSANVIVWNKDEKKRDDIEDLARARHHSKGFTTDILSESVVQHVKSYLD